MLSKLYKNIYFLLGFYAVNHGLLLKITRNIYVRRAFPPGKWINPLTQICIDGYQRSGSTFFTYYYRSYNDALSLAHHTHSLQEIKRAIRYKIPLIICIRHPLDCLASLICTDKRLSITIALHTYIYFYQGLLKISHQLYFDLTKHKSDPWVLIQQLNNLCNTQFQAPILSTSELANLLSEIDIEIPRPTSSILSAATPNKEKEKEKMYIKEQLLKHPSYKKAEELYLLVSKNSSL